MSSNLARIPIFMRDLADVAARVMLEELDIDPARAEEVGLRISRDACAEHAGEMLYIPAGQALEIDERDRAMYAFYLRNGKDANAVARKFELVIQTVYRRIRLVEATLQAETQRPLFEESP